MLSGATSSQFEAVIAGAGAVAGAAAEGQRPQVAAQ